MRRVVVVLLVFLAIAGAAALWYFKLRADSKVLVLSGSIEARDAEVGPLVAGRIKEVLVDEGSTVRAGQPITTLEPDLIAPQVREQEAAVEEANANLERALHGPRSEELRRARIDSEVAETDRRRLEALLAQGVIPQQQYDAAAAKAARALESLHELERGTRPEDIEAARATLGRQQERLDYLRRQMEETVVRAPADGVIQSIDLRPGDLVGAGQPVAKILEPQELWVRVYVPEPRLGAVVVGQEAWITVDTWPGRKFPGRVVEIRERAEYTPRNIQTVDQRSDQVFGVKVAIDPSPDLKPGMAALVVVAPRTRS